MTGAARARGAALAVHLFTAGGAVAGLLAIAAAADGGVKSALLWMGVAVLVDGVDGALARLARVRDVLPAIDGTLLDNLVDYVNYAVVPAWLMHRSGCFPDKISLGVAGAILVAAALQFSRSDAKTGDHYFTGFPSYWNVLALYVLASGAAPWLAAALVGLLCVLTFVPCRWIYPTRTPRLRSLTLCVTAAWGAAALWMIIAWPDPPAAVVYGSLAYVVYYIAASLWLTRNPRDRGEDA